MRYFDSGVFAVTSPGWAGVFAKAESLATAHAANLCRSLDTLHVALALELGATEFCTFDQRQAVMAKAAGLPLVP
jgi:predicted nucleic acid-binding protein